MVRIHYPIEAKSLHKNAKKYMPRGLFLESPGNLPDPISIFLTIFCELDSDFRHDTWPMFS